MFNFYYIANKDTNVHNPNLESKICKKDALINLISNQLDTDKIYLYAKDPNEAIYQFLLTNVKVET